MNEQLATLVGNVLIHWAALVGTLSVIVHVRVFDPRSSVSRHLLWYMLIIALVLDLSVIRIHFGDAPWFALLRLIVFIGVPMAMTQRLIIQLRAQRDAPSTDPAPHVGTSDTPGHTEE